MDWNVLRGQRGKGWLSSSLFEEFIAFFKKMPKLTAKMTKTQNFPIFKVFMHILSNFRQTSSTTTFKRVNKERMCRPVDFSEEFVAVFIVKMSHIDTENGKNIKIFQFSKILCIFGESFDRLRGLE